MATLDLRLSEIPEWADRDWYRQRIIDHFAAEAGELSKAEAKNRARP